MLQGYAQMSCLVCNRSYASEDLAIQNYAKFLTLQIFRPYFLHTFSSCPLFWFVFRYLSCAFFRRASARRHICHIVARLYTSYFSIRYFAMAVFLFSGLADSSCHSLYTAASRASIRFACSVFNVILYRFWLSVVVGCGFAPLRLSPKLDTARPFPCEPSRRAGGSSNN